jgi:hypothetical protein
MKRLLFLFAIMVLLGTFCSLESTSGATGNEVDNILYGELLNRNVKNGLVNYRGLKNEEDKLDRYLRILEKTETRRLSRTDRFAFYISDAFRNPLEGNTLDVSRIFDWYAKDFGRDVLGFFLKYAKGDFKKRLEANRSNIKITYLDYDWSLNGE